jgi:hypothetical protein
VRPAADSCVALAVTEPDAYILPNRC